MRPDPDPRYPTLDEIGDMTDAQFDAWVRNRNRRVSWWRRLWRAVRRNR